MAGTKFISPGGFIRVPQFLRHVLSIFGVNESVAIEIAILLSTVHDLISLVSKTLLSSVLLTTFWTQTPFWQWWLLRNPTSVTDICQILYAYHAIKGNLPSVCSETSKCICQSLRFLLHLHLSQVCVGAQCRLRCAKGQRLRYKTSKS